MENTSIQQTQMKPILRLVFDSAAYRIVTAETTKRLLENTKKMFGDRYDVVVMTKDVDIIPDHTTVVNLAINSDTDLNTLIELINKLGEGIYDTPELKDQMD